MRTGSRFARKGFTLVELLVVMVIIGILATLLVVGVMAALRAAREGRIRTEIMGLAAAVETYKATYGEYPPSNRADLVRHLQRLFPRIDAAELGNVPANVDQSNILVFCLSGYSSDARHPLTGTGAEPYFSFDNKRLKNDAGEVFNPEVDPNPRGYRYIPPGSDVNIPYIYFRKQWDNTSKSYVWGTNQSYTATPGGTVTAKKISKDFQIVCAGLETEFGIDDITSFQDGTEEEED